MKTLLFVGYISTFGADAASTHAALAAGGREMMLTQSPWANDAILAGMASGSWPVISALSKRHPRWAFVMGASIASLHTWAAIHNVQAARR
jgi:hypothetical protein